MNKLRHMSIFAHVVEAGSITGAAESLQLSKSVVSQHLKVLEQELGVLLIKRSTRKHLLTSAGKNFYDSCKAINKISDSAWQQAQESIAIPKGRVKITAPNALMTAVVAPAIGKLLNQFPLLEPELISEDEHVDLMSDNIDLAIRVGSSQASNIKQRRIGQFRDVFCGDSQLLAHEEIGNIHYIANQWQGSDIAHQFTDNKGNITRYQANVKCRANSFNTCLALIKSGAGVGIIPDFQFNLAKPALSEVFPNHHLPINSVYALYPYEKHLPLSIKVCVNAIEKQLKTI